MARHQMDRRRDRGIVLIFCAGILTILAGVGMSLFAMVQMQVSSTVRYTDAVRAEWMALAGIHDGVARIRELARQETETPNAKWYMTDHLKDAARHASFTDGSTNGIDDDWDGTVDEADEATLAYTRRMENLEGVLIAQYQEEIEDAQSRININAGDNLATILNNLCILIGPPLVAAEPDLLQPRRWFVEGASATYNTNPADTETNLGAYFEVSTTTRRPLTWGEYTAKYGGSYGSKPTGVAAYGDGYAIASYRARYGAFGTLDNIKNALTFVERNGNNEMDDPLEVMEVEAKFAALRPYITLASWVDTNTVGVGKFEWAHASYSIPVLRNVVTGNLDYGVSCDILIDRDKSWVADDPNDIYNERGSLRGSYVSIMNGHGAGQFRRIATNGPDWIAIQRSESSADDAALALLPGPISSYMIVAREDASFDADGNGTLDANENATFCPYLPNSGVAANHLDFAPPGDPTPNLWLQDNPAIDYSIRPLCIHRAPVNINTASGIVLTALFMGINVQHGHPLAIGTDADAEDLVKLDLPAAAGATDWRIQDTILQLESYLLTARGLKRIPAGTGKLVFDHNLSTFLTTYGLSSPNYRLDYLNQYGSLWGANAIGEAHELAIRIMVARQRFQPISSADPDPILQIDLGGNYERGPFRDWDDFYFRVIRPFDDKRYDAGLEDTNADGQADKAHKVPVAKMLMANFNSNTDILKFNPNIEWIDRWGRNFTEMEPVMVFSGSAPRTVNQPWAKSKPAGAPQGSYLIRSLRYQSSEMIDKTDLNRGTTEFSFDSNGTFEITATGQVIHPLTGQLLAERKLESVVKIYDVWRESTQRQFVRGRFSTAIRANHNSINGTQASGYTDAGRVARDNDPWSAGASAYASGATFKALDSLPEPLVPLNYMVKVKKTADGFVDFVDTTVRDVWGNAKSSDTEYEPDIVANRVLPANYDGQLILAANTSVYTPGGDTDDTFLASFDGDADTPTCVGNGREQAKAPRDCKTRVADSIGLLGVMNDKEIDIDPDNPVVEFFITTASDLPGLPFTETDPVTSVAGTYAWWHNQSVRMGDLRADGMFVGAVGTSLKEGSLKYPMDDCQAKEAAYNPGANEPNPHPTNFYPGSPDGFTVTMWFKPNWHGADNREHDFFDATTLGDTSWARYCHLYKAGRFSFAKRIGVSGGDGSSGVWERNNDLVFGTEDGQRAAPYGSDDDEDFMSFLHGGTKNVPTDFLPPKTNAETPAFHVQPFRWGYVGAKFTYRKNAGAALPPWMDIKTWGFWHMNTKPEHNNWWDAAITNLGHAFIDTQRKPEGPTWGPDYYWIYSQEAWDGFAGLGQPDLRGQPAAFIWANYATANTTRRKGVFSTCNINESTTSWLYRATPIDGTYATIDELRLTKKAWESDRIAAETTTSRYYLPASPETQANCPYFLSQSLLQSIKGQGTTVSDQSVVLLRVSWTAFTPRFMHEYKEPGTYSHKEYIHGDSNAASQAVWGLNYYYPGANPSDLETVDIRGPFDYPQYNRSISYDANVGWKDTGTNAPIEWLGVARPIPTPNVQPHYTKGLEVELWNGTTIAGRIAGLAWNPISKSFDPVNTFTNPAVLNTFPLATRVNAGDLRYCVRFRYPVSSDVDFNGATKWLTDEKGRPAVNPAKHYLLDTPVLDDVSVTYITRVRFLQYREVRE